MNLTTLQTRLRERIGNPDTTDVPDATLTLRINEAMVDILDNYNFHATKGTSSTIVTVVGTRGYTPAVGTDVLIGVRDNTNGVKLRKMDRVEFDELDADTVVVNAKPTSYFWDGTTLSLNPPPDGIYTIRIRRRVATTELAAAGDSPVIPTSWHHGIVLKARSKYYETKEDLPKYKAAEQVFQDWVTHKTDEVAEDKKADYDAGVRLPDLERFSSGSILDFDHED